MCPSTTKQGGGGAASNQQAEHTFVEAEAQQSVTPPHSSLSRPDKWPVMSSKLQHKASKVLNSPQATECYLNIPLGA